MTCEEKLQEILQIYQRVSLLSDKNGCKVLRIRHRALQKDLVLHLLPSANSAYETLCGIRCENLPVIYDRFPLEDGMLVLEEYIDGLTVSQIAETGKYRKHGAVKVIRAICRGLEVLHDNGIVHRDIKPENIMIDKNGRVVIIDFNAARSVSAKPRDTVIMGTVGYASPEQLGIAQSDARTDLYAVGVLLNVMLTGKHPSETVARGRLGRIVRKCTAINPNDRYRSAKQLAAALHRLV